MGCWSIAGLPPSIKFAGTHLCTWVERGYCEGALTMRPPRLPLFFNFPVHFNFQTSTWDTKPSPEDFKDFQIVCFESVALYESVILFCRDHWVPVCLNGRLLILSHTTRFKILSWRLTKSKIPQLKRFYCGRTIVICRKQSFTVNFVFQNHTG